MPALPNFIGGSYTSEALTADSERTVNLFVDVMQSEGAVVRKALLPTPGVIKISEAGIGPGRAHFAQSGREFAVIGAKLYEISYNGALTDRGDVALGVNPATISSNGDGGDQLFITSGDNGYVYDLTANTLSQVSALDGKATFGGFSDGYFLALDSDTSTFYISALFDGTSWTTGIDFTQRSLAPDPWKALYVVGRNIWLLGELTSEVWYNAGASSFPFAPHESGLVLYGIAAPFSGAGIDRDLVWLGTTKEGDVKVLRAAGYQVEVVSNNHIQRVVTGYDRIVDAVADTYSDRGHNFYVLNFPASDASWSWDASTNLWHERGTWSPTLRQFQSLRPRWHAYAFNEHRILDAITGSVYQLCATCSYDVDDMLVRRMRRYPAPVTDNERVFYSSFELDLESGLGLETGQGSDPQVMMRYSDDGGRTWSSEKWRSAGKIGEYSHRVKWDRCGSGRKRVWEVVMTDPVPWRITNAYVNLAQPAGSNTTKRGSNG